LVDDIEKRGKKGETIKVKRGFARNLLIPRKMAGNDFKLTSNSVLRYV
jgi:ribosomal protein L9